MKLIKLRKADGSYELFNTSKIIYSDEVNGKTTMTYRYFGQNIQIPLYMDHSTFISTISANRKYNVEELPLKVLFKGDLTVGQDKVINLEWVYRGEVHTSGTRLICDGSIFGKDTPVYLIVEESLDEIAALQTIEATGSGDGVASMVLDGIELTDSENLIAHEKGIKLKALFINLDGTWQAWPFNFGSGEDELSESETENQFYLPFSESKTVSLSLIF